MAEGEFKRKKGERMKSSLGYEILYQDTARPKHSTKVTGIRKVRCPRCGNEFKQSGSGGCFTMRWTPMDCPSDCGFPWPEKEVQSSASTSEERVNVDK